MPWNESLQRQSEKLVERLSANPTQVTVWNLTADERALIVRALNCLMATNSR